VVLLCNDPRHLRTLEVNLGPDVGDVQMRIGLNSGAVTAPVLRHEKGRLQLFGDTVNMAARMEANRFRDRRLCGRQHCHHCWQHQGKVIVNVIGNIDSILWQWWWVTAGGSSGFGSVVIIIHHFRGRWYHPHQLRHRRFPWHHHGEAVFNVVSDMGSKLHQWCCVVGGRGSGVG